MMCRYKNFFLQIFLGLIWGALIINQASADDLKVINSRLETIEKDLSVLQRQVYRSSVYGVESETKEVKAVSTDVPKSYSDYLTSRMDSIDQALTMITNQVEEVTFKNNNLTEKLDKVVRDIEFRLNEIENKKIIAEPVEVKDEAKNEKISEKPLPNKEEDPEKMYNRAYDELKKSNYDKAEEYLTAFLERFPENELAGNAQYWLGETHYVRGRFEKSAVAFAKCYEKYGKGSKGADCLLKLGLSMGSLNKTNEACVAFKSLPKEYPKSLEPIKKRAEAEIKRLNCK